MTRSNWSYVDTKARRRQRLVTIIVLVVAGLVTANCVGWGVYGFWRIFTGAS